MTSDIPKQSTTPVDWYTANQQFLAGFVEFARWCIQQADQQQNTSSETGSIPESTPVDWAAHLRTLKSAIPGISPIDYLAQLYQLTEFEQQVLLLAVAPELDSRLLYRAGKAGVEGAEVPMVINFSFAMAVLPNPEWQSIAAGGNLRRNGLLKLDTNTSVTQARLLVPESIVHFIVGIADEDQELLAFSEDIPPPETDLDAKNQALCLQIKQLWESSLRAAPCLITLTGDHGDIKQETAAGLAKHLGLRLKLLSVHFLPSDLQKLKALAEKWQREIKLHNYLLLLDCDTDTFVEPATQSMADHFINLIQCPLLCASSEPRKKSLKRQYSFEVSAPDSAEQLHCWQQCLGGQVSDDDIKQVVSHFSMTLTQIHKNAKAWFAIEPRPELWSLCKNACRQQTLNLAQRIEPSEGAANIVLPKLQHGLLQDILAHIRYQNVVYQDWGFVQNSGRGRGLTALFHGASGTGKTTAAEYLALQLDLDLYRVDLSNVVSKYIGETEKNLNQIFDSAEKSGAILLFDEADALFSKRTAVSGSNDKFANAQVSYLLQRLESFKGLAILTSNLKDAFDQAFIRRLRFVVQFPFPEKSERRQIWQTLLPADAPSQDIDFNKLAALNVAGGVIRNITLSACIEAASKNQPLSMLHYLNATRYEYLKQDKSLPVQEVQGWV